MKALIKAWNDLINKQPDIFDDRSLSIAITILSNDSDTELICGVLNLLKHATLMHEFNRQNIINAEIMNSLKPLIHKEDVVSEARSVHSKLKITLAACT